MTFLRKKILLFKIQKAIKKNSFVLFFQYNNVKYKEWILLNSLILSLQDTGLLVCKNKLTPAVRVSLLPILVMPEIMNLEITLNAFKQFKDITINTVPYFDENQVIRFFCQGPTVIISTNSVNSCKNICDILGVTDIKPYFTLKHRFRVSEKLREPCYDIIKIINRQQYTSIMPTNFTPAAKQPQRIKFESDKFLGPRFLKQEFPRVFNQKKQPIDLFNTENLNLKKNFSFFEKKFFFVGGLAQNQIIDHLDLKNFCKLDNSVYTKLVTIFHNPVESLVALPIYKQKSFLHCLMLGNNLSS